jgi:hypothetical protein
MIKRTSNTIGALLLMSIFTVLSVNVVCAEEAPPKSEEELRKEGCGCE